MGTLRFEYSEGKHTHTHTKKKKSEHEVDIGVCVLVRLDSVKARSKLINVA